MRTMCGGQLPDCGSSFDLGRECSWVFVSTTVEALATITAFIAERGGALRPPGGLSMFVIHAERGGRVVAPGRAI